jgi:tight adherence protein C
MEGLPWFVMALTAAAAVSTIAFLGEVLRSLPTDSAARTERLPMAWRLAWPLLIAGGCLVRPIISARWRFNLHKKLSGAGFERTMAPQHIVAAQALSLVAAGIAYSALQLAGLGCPIWIFCGGALAGMMWPMIWLRSVANRRRESLLRSLPFLIDLLAMAVESGLPLTAALPQAVERLPAGPLRDECRRLMRDVKAGMPRDEALRLLAVRLDMPAITQFTLAVTAAQRDGGTVVQTLRAQAEQQRSDRFLRAEHRAAQAPVRVLFPLIVFIFPGTLAIVLYPVVSRMLTEVTRWQ